MAGQPSAPEDHAATLLPTEPRHHDTVFMVGVQRPFRSWGLMVRRRQRVRAKRCPMTGSAPSPDDASHRRENHEARLVASSFETRVSALLRMRG